MKETDTLKLAGALGAVSWDELNEFNRGSKLIAASILEGSTIECDGPVIGIVVGYDDEGRAQTSVPDPEATQESAELLIRSLACAESD